MDKNCKIDLVYPKELGWTVSQIWVIHEYTVTCFVFCVWCRKKDDPDRIESGEALTQSTGSACYIFNAIWAMQQWNHRRSAITAGISSVASMSQALNW